jgi:hypothetical protein
LCWVRGLSVSLRQSSVTLLKSDCLSVRKQVVGLEQVARLAWEEYFND